MRVPLLTFTMLALVVAVCPLHTIRGTHKIHKMPSGHKCVLENVDPSRLLPPNARHLCPQHTHSIIIRKSRLRRFPVIFTLYPDLNTLDVTDNNIIYIDLLTFEEAHSLKVLKLSGNNFTSLRNYTFSGASFLVRLDLKRCGITDLNMHTFLGLSQLTILDLSENRIQKLPYGVFSNMFKLTVLNLGSNQIEIIDNRILIRQLILRTLILSKNRLKKIHQNAFMTANLATLDLDHNPTLKYLKLADVCMEQMETLKVNNCSLETLFVPPNAMTVEASYNNISYIVPVRTINNQDFKLRRLNLDHNRLNHFGNLTEFDKLEMLDINDNLITTLNLTQLKFMRKLTLIQVARNPLAGSVDANGIVASLPALQELTISKNEYNDAYLAEVSRNLSVHKILLIIDKEEEVSPEILDPTSTTAEESEIPKTQMPRTAADLRNMVVKMKHNYQVDSIYLLQLENNNTRLIEEWTSVAMSRDRIHKIIVTSLIWMYCIVILNVVGIIFRIFLKRNAIREWFDRRSLDEQPLRAIDEQPLRHIEEQPLRQIEEQPLRQIEVQPRRQNDDQTLELREVSHPPNEAPIVGYESDISTDDVQEDTL